MVRLNGRLLARVSALELVAQFCCLLCASLGTERASRVRAKKLLALECGSSSCQAVPGGDGPGHESEVARGHASEYLSIGD